MVDSAPITQADVNDLDRAAVTRFHPRLRDHVWSLVAKALIAMRYGSYGSRTR